MRENRVAYTVWSEFVIAESIMTIKMYVPRMAIAALAACLVLSGCQRAKPVKVGFLGGLSGRVSDLAIDGRNGVQLAIEEANAQGGLQGRPIELLVKDDEQQDQAAKRAMQAFADAKVDFVVGPMTSQVAVAATPVANASRIPLISPTATTHDLSGSNDFFFRVVPDAPAGAKQQADYLYRQGSRSLVTLADARNRAYSASWSVAAAKQFSARGGKVLAQLEFQSGNEAHIKELAQQLTQHQSDAILIVTGAVDAALIAAQVRQLDQRVSLAVAPWAGTEQLIQLGGKAVEGMMVPQYFDRESQEPRYRQFVSRFTKRFGEPPGFAATNAYDAAQAGLAALARTDERRPLHLALVDGTPFQGLQHPVVIDSNGDSHGDLFLTRIQRGHFAALPRE